MIVRLFSDIHLSSESYTISPQHHDKDAVLVLAGDLGEQYAYPVPFVEKCCRQFKHVIYVLGNHEFYYGEYYAVKAAWKEVEERIDNLYVLDNETKIIGDIRFIGSTMWTDINHGNPTDMANVGNCLNDFRVIRIDNGGDADYTFTVGDSMELHKLSVEYITSELEQPFDGTTFVVTHHAPSPLLVHEDYKDSDINSAFYANCDHLIDKYDIDTWMFGHMHQANNLVIGDTQTYCNPRGYVRYYGAEDTGIDHEWFIDIP